jgi:hypothetical protein
MQHLNLENLARLVDESPTHEERVHLEHCAACRDELQEMRAQTAALADLPLLEAPDRGWPLLRARLAHEGLLHSGASAPRSGWGAPRLLRAAAYVGLFLLGGAAGLAVGGGGSAPAPEEGSRFGTGGTAAVTAPAAEAAAFRLEQAEASYLEALTQYQEASGMPYGTNPAARLAALEGIMLSTRAALEAAPADPMINGYYLNAVGQRDAVLRQIARTTQDPWF